MNGIAEQANRGFGRQQENEHLSQQLDHMSVVMSGRASASLTNQIYQPTRIKLSVHI